MINYTQGIQMDKAGHIIVDEYQNTNAKNIYALGDVCGKALLTPGKRQEGFTKFLHTSPSSSISLKENQDFYYL